MKLDRAKDIADLLVSQIGPVCERIEIAGSIRRGKDDVKDVELVCIPKGFALYNWAREVTCPVNWIKPGTDKIITWHPKPDAKYLRGIVDAAGEEMKLDLFIATPENWGVIMTIRTGPADFSQALVTHIKNKTDLRVTGGRLVNDKKQPIDTPTEESFFAAAGLGFVAVKERDRPDPYGHFR